MSKEKKREISMDDLAQMVARGFTGVDKKFEQIDKRFEHVDKRFELVFEGMDLMRDDIHDIKTTLGPLLRMTALQDSELQKMSLRISRLEKFTGVGSR